LSHIDSLIELTFHTLFLDNNHNWLLVIKVLSLNNDVASMENSWNESEAREANIDKEVATTSSGKENREWRKDKGQNKEAAISTSHLDSDDEDGDKESWNVIRKVQNFKSNATQKEG